LRSAARIALEVVEQDVLAPLDPLLRRVRERLSLRRHDEERDAHLLIVQAGAVRDHAVLAERLAVVGRDEHPCARQDPAAVEVAQEGAELGVECPDLSS